MRLPRLRFFVCSHACVVQAMAQTGRGYARPEQPSPRLIFLARTVSRVGCVLALQFMVGGGVP